jgi:hypothetical protein
MEERRKMLESSSWRDWLKTYFQEQPGEQERVASEIGVHPLSLLRWINGTSKPRPHYLIQLHQALPMRHQNLFAKLLEPENLMLPAPLSDLLYEINVSFFKQILEIRAMTLDRWTFQTICAAVFKHALMLLDPQSMGMAMRVIQCMPPARDGKIHSLRTSEGRGTPFWNTDLEYQPFLLGAESLAGYVVSVCHPQSRQTEHNYNDLPFPAIQHVPFASTVALPILCAQHIAGCLLVSSTQPNYFLSSDRLTLLQTYTQLLSLAFTTDQFYPIECIELKIMPCLKQQQAHIGTFRRRVIAMMRKKQTANQNLTWPDAERRVWQQLEEEMIQLVRTQKKEQ